MVGKLTKIQIVIVSFVSETYTQRVRLQPFAKVRNGDDDWWIVGSESEGEMWRNYTSLTLLLSCFSFQINHKNYKNMNSVQQQREHHH